MTGLAARAAGLRRNAEGPEDEPGTARDPDCRGALPGARQRAFDLAAIALGREMSGSVSGTALLSRKNGRFR